MRHPTPRSEVTSPAVGNESRFIPAKLYKSVRSVTAAIAKLPAAQVRGSRHVTPGDMELALAELRRRMPEWRAEIEGAGESWGASLYRKELQQMQMHAYPKRI